MYYLCNTRNTRNMCNHVLAIDRDVGFDDIVERKEKREDQESSRGSPLIFAAAVPSEARESK